MTRSRARLKVLQPCCAAWQLAHRDGTDNEEYDSLLHYWNETSGPPYFGHGLPSVRYCPWCATPKEGAQCAHGVSLDEVCPECLQAPSDNPDDEVLG